MGDLGPPPSREYAAVLAGEELAAYAFIRTWMADDVDKGMPLIERHHVPQEAALFVLSLVRVLDGAQDSHDFDLFAAFIVPTGNLGAGSWLAAAPCR